MKKIAIITDSNSGITKDESNSMGIFVLAMPFMIDGVDYLEGVNLTNKEFYEMQEGGADITTSQPSIADVINLWDEVLKDYTEIVHIPMSSSLSSSYETALMLSRDYDGKVQVVNNQRISVTQKSSVFQAKELVAAGKTAVEIKDILEEAKFNSSIYVTLDTLKYLKKGGRITPTAAALGEFLKIKPVLQIHGGKLDAFAKARTKKNAKKIMMAAIKNDITDRFGMPPTGAGMNLFLAYSGDDKEIQEFLSEVQEVYPNHTFIVDPLSLSVGCHIGIGAIAIACEKKIGLDD